MSLHYIGANLEVILPVIASFDKSRRANESYVDLNHKNLTCIFRNIAHQSTILIQFKTVRLASKCMFGDTEVKVTVVAVIAVTLSGIMVTFLPVPFQMVIYDSLSQQRQGKPDASYGAGDKKPISPLAGTLGNRGRRL